MKIKKQTAPKTKPTQQETSPHVIHSKHLDYRRQLSKTLEFDQQINSSKTYKRSTVLQLEQHKVTQKKLTLFKKPKIKLWASINPHNKET